ncbi:MAG: hypothetical protein J6Y91_01130 [Alphaproteobacteria bacterium]|nr:hypothetical protein [Alphaproteobacteria bacterium]
MTYSLNKLDLIWLIDNTEVANVCASIDECNRQELVLKVYRAHHRGKVEEIFADFKTAVRVDKDKNICIKIKNFTPGDFYDSIEMLGGKMFLNSSDGKIYYVPLDKHKNRRLFNQTPSRILANLPSHKKLEILKSFSQDCFYELKYKTKHELALAKKTDKLFALLQLKIPKEFMDDEMRKIRLITAEIAQIQGIKKKLENFNRVPRAQQKSLLKTVCELTAKYNRIDTPNVKFLSQKQIDKDEGLDKWVSTEAFTYGKNVCINMDYLDKIDGAQALSMAWHETTHVAQATGDYSQYPLVEEMFGRNLDYLQKMPETYLFHPQEQVVFALEKQFIEKLVENTKIRTNDKTFEFMTEYNVAEQYFHRAIQRKI